MCRYIFGRMCTTRHRWSTTPGRGRSVTQCRRRAPVRFNIKYIYIYIIYACSTTRYNTRRHVKIILYLVYIGTYYITFIMCVLRIPTADFAHTHTDMIRINYRLVILQLILLLLLLSLLSFYARVLINYNTRTSII